MSESLRAIDKSASQNKNIKEKLRQFENIFDRYKHHLIRNSNSILNSDTGNVLYRKQHIEFKALVWFKQAERQKQL